jgi:hypothetical protein
MKNRKKISIWLVRILVVFSMLIILILVLSPRLINLEIVRNQIKDRVMRDIGGDIKYRRMVLAYFPQPHVLIHRAEVRIPDGFTIKVHRLRIYPKLWSLIRGEVGVSRVRLEYADYFMKLPQISKTAPVPKDIVSVDTIVKEIARAITRLPEFKLPDIKINVKYGKIDLVDPFGRQFKLREVQAEYHSSPQRLDYSIECKSNLWDQIDIEGYLNPADFQGRGNIGLSRFRPQTLLAYLLPDSRQQITDARASLNIDFELLGVGNLKATFDGAIPVLQLGRNKNKLAFKGGRLNGVLNLKEGVIKVELTELGLKDPHLVADANFSYDENLNDIRLSIGGTQIDVDAVRRMTLALAGESGIIKNVFDIIRGGHVPRISVQTRGRSMAELGTMENIVIKGQMNRGNIFIPGAGLDLVDVYGDALIANGVLNGDNLQARLGKTRGQNGRLQLGLNDAIEPLKLQINVKADLAQLPPVLNRIVDDADFSSELAKIRDVNGTASGVLILGDALDDLRAEVNVTRAEMSARYDRIPYPIHLAGGRFTYKDRRIAVDKFKARIGKTTINQLSSTIGWSGTPSLVVKTTGANLDLNEIHSWLMSLEDFQKNAPFLQSVDGNVAVEKLSVKGPFFNPRAWKWQGSGALNNLRIDSKRLPRQLHVTGGRFSGSQEAITLADMDASLGKSTISQLSAHIELNKRGAFDLQTQSINLAAQEIYPWLATLEDFRPALEDFKAQSGNLTLYELVLSGPIHQPENWHYQVYGDMQRLVIESKALTDPVTIENGRLELTTELSIGAPSTRIKFKPTKLTWGDSRLTFGGDIGLIGNDVRLDSTISADAIDWNRLDTFLDYIAKKGAGADQSPGKGRVLGSLKVRTKKFIYDILAFEPLEAEVTFKPEKVVVTIQQALLCGINIRGLLNVDEQTLEVYLVPTAGDQDLASSAACITGEKKPATGTFSLNGELLSKSKPQDFLRSLSGNLSFTAKDGRIYRLGLLAKILSILNVTEIYRGEVPDLTGEGFAYRTMTANAEIKGGKIIMKQCSIDGVSMGIACDGKIDFIEKKMNLTVLVAPFRTVDRIVDLIPLVGHVLGGKLISIPFQAKGDLKDPAVIPLPPMAVGSEVLGILERTLKLPITIIQPIFSNGKDKQKDQKEKKEPGPPVQSETDR